MCFVTGRPQDANRFVLATYLTFTLLDAEAAVAVEGIIRMKSVEFEQPESGLLPILGYWKV